MADEKKFTWTWWHTAIVTVVAAYGAYQTFQQKAGDKAIDKLHADSSFARSERFVRNEWMFQRMRDQYTYGPPNKVSHNR